MSRLLTTTLAAAAALSFAAPTLAQDTMGAMSSGDMPMCSSTVTDHCRQHEGMSGTMMHHGMMKDHRMMRHHHMTKHHKHMTKHHKHMMKHHTRNMNAATPAVPAHKM